MDGFKLYLITVGISLVISMLVIIGDHIANEKIKVDLAEVAAATGISAIPIINLFFIMAFISNEKDDMLIGSKFILKKLYDNIVFLPVLLLLSLFFV